MMIGPMKRKMITVGIVAFLIPTLISVILFTTYSSSKKEQIKELEAEKLVVQKVVFSGDLPVNHVITEKDIKVVGVKEVSAPRNSYNEQRKFDVVGRKLKIPVYDKTIVTETMFYKEDDLVERDLRRKEFNMINLPSDLVEGDYIDIRILYPNGEDYLVTVGKEIKQIGLNAETNSMVIELTEEELIKLSGAVIDSYIMDGVNLYAVKYVEVYEQLFNEEAIDYAAKYEEALATLIEDDYQMRYEEALSSMEPETNASGEIIYNMSGEPMYAPINIERKTAVDFTVDEIIALFDLSDKKYGFDYERQQEIKESEEFRNIITTLKDAYVERDTETINEYRNSTLVVSKWLEPTYPVRKEVATLLARNPNVVDQIRVKYSDIDALLEERQFLLDQELKITDPYTGEVTFNDAVTSKAVTKLDEEIENQKTERKEFLQNLIRSNIAAGL